MKYVFIVWKFWGQEGRIICFFFVVVAEVFFGQDPKMTLNVLFLPTLENFDLLSEFNYYNRF